MAVYNFILRVVPDVNFVAYLYSRLTVTGLLAGSASAPSGLSTQAPGA